MSNTSTSSNGSSSSTSEGSTSRLYALHDQWHVTSVATATGTVVERYAYEAFGTSIVLTPSFAVQSASLFDWETRFGAYRLDIETLLYCVRFRYLHPPVGRWVNNDPLREIAGINLFVYVDNAPNENTDLTGLLDPGRYSIPELERQLFPEGDIPPWVHHQLGRGCVGLSMVLQHCPGEKAPPSHDYSENAPGTECFLSEILATARKCLPPRKNFVFGKFGPWKDGKAPTPKANGAVPTDSIDPPGGGYNYVSCLQDGKGKTVYAHINYSGVYGRLNEKPAPECFVESKRFPTSEKYPHFIWCSTCVCPNALGGR